MFYTRDMSKEVIHSVILISALGLSFLFARSPLAAYDLQFAAALFIVFFIVRHWLSKQTQTTRLLESVIFTLIVASVVNSTGGSSSPFFFLLYFLLFSLSLLLEPVISITVSLAAIIFLLLALPPNQDLKNLLPVFSLAFLTPFALLLGQTYLKEEEDRKNAERLKNSLTDNKKETFLFLSLMLKNHIRSIKQTIENFMGDKELHTIKKHTSEMEKLIEKFENGF